MIPHKHTRAGLRVGERESFMPEITMLNPRCRSDYRNAYLLWFGACGVTRLHVFADSLDDALEECVDWIAEHAPGLLADEAVHDEYKRLLAEGKSEEQAAEGAEVDTTICDGGHYLHSWEWGICLEGFTGREFLAYVRGE